MAAGKPSGAAMRVVSAGHQPALDVFRHWDGAADASLPEGVGTVWQVSLPAEPQDARRFLTQQASQLRSAQRALPAAQRRLLDELTSMNTSGDASFLAGERVLAQANNPRAVLAAAVLYESSGETFAIWDRFRLNPQTLRTVGQRFSSFADQVQRAISQFALVETQSAGQRLATSRVDWTGNIDTRWSSGADRDQLQMHALALQNALITRQNWLQFFLLVTAGAARVGAALASGPFSLVAIWAAWNYLQTVVDEFQQLHTQTTG